MTMRLENVGIDAREPRALAEWWAEALGWVLHDEEAPGVFDVCEKVADDGSYPFPELVIGVGGDVATMRERIHFDLNSFSLDDQAATVERLLALGATRADVGQAADAPFVVLADPEGNNFCVLDPRPEYAGLGSLAGLTLAAHDAQAIKDVWRVATGWEVTRDEPDYVVLESPDAVAPLEIITRPTMARHEAKNRIHLDVRPIGEPQADVVARLLALGATRPDIGQDPDDPTITWVTLADQEGNELCVLASRDE